MKCLLPAGRFVIVGLLTALFASCQVDGKERIFYIGVTDIVWDYAPSGQNRITGEDFSSNGPEAQFVLQGPDRIGKTYKKAVYREFTDDTFSEQIPQPEWLGLLGPLMYAEVGDVMIIHFKNLASHSFTLHPHGVFYTKSSEGALYRDGTSGSDKLDDTVQPGGNHTYIWRVPERAGPTDDGPNCIPWQYHTHIDSERGTNSGPMGAMIICRQGILDSSGRRRTDVDKDFILLFTITDENLSYYLDENIQTYALDPSSVDKGDSGFKNSNKMNGINGFVFGNLPGLDMCQGETIDWHLLGMGTQEDVHTAFFHGNTLLYDNHRIDSMKALPAGFESATMEAHNPGIWLIASEVANHLLGGALALYNVQSTCGEAAEVQLSGVEREFYIQAEEYIWNYAPSGMDKWTGQDLVIPGGEAKLYFETGENRIGASYKKARFQPYTDATFMQPISRSADEEYLGFLGPIIRAEVGDTIKVTFRNNASRPYSMTPHGVWYDKGSEGRLYEDGNTETRDENVEPGNTVTYTWAVPEFVAPGASDGQCITWHYFSSVDPEKDIYSGLIGPLLVCRKGTLDGDGKQTGVDKEFAVFFSFMDENRSWYLQDNIDSSPNPIDTSVPSFYWSNQMASINGYMFSNIEDLTMCAGDTVSWHLVAAGQWWDPHPVYFRGNSFVVDGVRRDTLLVYPGVDVTAIMYPDNIGTWSFECQMHGHFVAGMKGFYEVSDCGQFQEEQLNGIERTYYIAAVEREWDYAPVKTGDLMDPTSIGYIYTHQGNTSIGSKYKKALYREYTDETFTVEKMRGKEEIHLGALGPFIRAEVGDNIRIIFKNMAASISYSIHPHGVLYRKASEGSSYNDGVNETGIVAPGDTYTYNWFVPQRAGPSESGPNCVVYSYYSCVDCRKDPYSGLTGPLVICRPGILGSDGRRTDVDHEYVLQFYIYEESLSHYYKENKDTYIGMPDMVNTNPFFRESNRMYAINGFVYDNLKGLEMTRGDNVAWYVIGLGHENDVHPVHFHGQVMTYNTEITHRADVYELLPGEFAALLMVADDPGEWLLHCHANRHKSAGMETMFIVHEQVPEQSGHPCVRTCQWPPEPKKCSYIFTVEWLQSMSSACFDCPVNLRDCNRPGCIPVNGVRRPIVVVNRQLPGPQIQVCEDDEIEVKVWNRLGNSEGTSIHWHGIHQRDTPYMDGAMMITQCPISPQSSFTYKFKANPAGTQWWHSHSNLQRHDGMFGALVVKQASKRDIQSGLYDYDLPEHVVFIQDWFHNPAIHRATVFFSDNDDTSLTINNKGVFQDFTSGNDTVFTPREIFNVRRGARYRFRVIGNNICHMTVSVEDHKLNVIATDGAPIKPILVDRIGVASGERYDFVLTADQNIANYWFRVYTDDPGCTSSASEEFAILRYEGAPREPLEDFVETSDGVFLNPRSTDETPAGIYLGQVNTTVPNDKRLLGQPDALLYIAVGSKNALQGNNDAGKNMLCPFDFDRSSRQINHVNFKTPSSPPLTQYEDLLKDDLCPYVDDMTDECEEKDTCCYCTQFLKIEIGQVVELVLVDQDGADHPLHIHGYSVRLVGMGKLDNRTTVDDVKLMDQQGSIKRNLEDAILKDSIPLQGNGYAIVRFVADNPGWWSLHSQDIATTEMAIVLQVGEPSDLPPVPDNFPRCGSWAPPAVKERKGQPHVVSNKKSRKVQESSKK